ncbi:MAG TPA: hypothetical protein HPP56_01350, partial [Nitrospirae bacterium]|nr:hypothetical protein [Nitrospirota bacterium]
MNMKVLIVLIVIIGLAVVLSTIFIGDRLFDGTVVDKPYDRGVNWDKTQAKKQKLIVTSE